LIVGTVGKEDRRSTTTLRAFSGTVS